MSRNRLVLVVGLFVALVLAGGVSYYASSAPDGLEKVSADKGLDAGARDHDLGRSPFADYGTQGVGSDRLSTGLAGVLGVIVTFGVGAAVVHVVRRREAPARDAAETPADDDPVRAG